MIILNFIIDYVVMIFLPIDTFFIVNEIDKNNLFYICLVGGLVDIMYNKLFVFLIIILFFYLIIKKLRIKSKYYYSKNIVVFILFFVIISIFRKKIIIEEFLISFILQLLYMFLYKKLLK